MTEGTEPKRSDQVSLVLHPGQLAEFGKIDPKLPALILEARREELRRNFLYAVLSLLAGLSIACGTLGRFIYLVMQDHASAGALLLGGGVLGLGLGFVRSRL